ncbi:MULTISPECIES: HlyD family efflux transporter periplasmic adaptor subunit [unclassified Fusibacter]|uniref:HlyD family efflux transporter periplasmic adaptor subunit n=1 Tax=unclassified Fusibacter TaxID=2624464 RepID=UPI0010134A5B|nr:MULTISPECIES: HlyD family efflux transporter periplasmic adaptor subunit [unclassified Fusibacter]MCK8058025.1 hypothetical protein [Fusibacter sp. A2]NPE20607.1 hypothetical protein [Fusibacter sp. A1]RXV62814.1 hypothetical protein DWB64_02150 [Fusibacter sp. A1]
MAKRKKKLNKGKFMSRLLMTAIFAYIAYSLIFSMFKPPSELIQLVFENVPIESSHRAVIIRSEQIVNSPTSGTFTADLGDGDRVKNGETIGRITVSDVEPLAEQVQAIESTVVLVDIHTLKSEADKMYAELVEALKSKAFIEASALQRELSFKLDRIQKAIDNESKSAFELKEAMVSGTSKVDAKVGDILPIRTRSSGLISYYIDGQEAQLTYDNRYQIAFDQLFEKTLTATNTAIGPVRFGTPLFKIVNTASWYIACEVRLEDFELYGLKSKVTVTLQGERLEGVIEDVFESEGAGVLMIKMSQQSSSMHNSRTVQVNIKRDEVKGLKVPKDALVNRNGFQGVLRVDVDRNTSFVPVEIIDEVGDDVIVQDRRFSYKNEDGDIVAMNTVRHGDQIVRTANKYREGEKID